MCVPWELNSEPLGVCEHYAPPTRLQLVVDIVFQSLLPVGLTYDAVLIQCVFMVPFTLIFCSHAERFMSTTKNKNLLKTNGKRGEKPDAVYRQCRSFLATNQSSVVVFGSLGCLKKGVVVVPQRYSVYIL